VRVVGWVYSDSQKVQCIVLLNEKNAIRGLALPNFYRPDVAEKFSLPDKHTGWIGYARVSSAQERLTAHVLFRGDNYWTALPKSYSLAEPGQVNSWVYSVNILPSP